MRLSPESRILIADLAILGALLLAAIGLLFVLVDIAGAADERRTYHMVAIREMASDNPAKWAHVHTHVAVRAFVTYVKTEADGDLHIRLCENAGVRTMDRKRCIVAEAIPLIPIKAPKLGQQILVQGIARYDAEVPNHSWWEIHPIEKLWPESP